MAKGKDKAVTEPQKKNEVARIAPRQPAVIDRMAMLNQAVIAGAPIELIERLMTMNAQHDADEARKSYSVAMTAAQAEMPTIVKDRPVSFGKTNYKHATLAAIEKAVKPVLSRHGITYRFKTSATPEAVVVTCIIEHVDGHREENSLPGPVDNSGGKNAIQAIGSTVTYLQRYTLMAALGLSASDDDDGRGGEAASDTITEDQVAQLRKEITEGGGDVEKFCQYAKVGNLSELPAGRFEAARTAIANANAGRRHAAEKAKAADEVHAEMTKGGGNAG